MITSDQLKDAQERTEALYRYLDIEAKTMELQEEQLRTGTPVSGTMPNGPKSK